MIAGLFEYIPSADHESKVVRENQFEGLTSKVSLPVV